MNPLTIFLESLGHLLDGAWVNVEPWGWVMLGVVAFILVIFVIWLIRLFLSLTKAD